jgi:putative tricarboxylic transport membrane protein
MDTFGQTIQIMVSLLTNPVYWFVLIMTVLITGPLGMIPGVGSTTVIAISLPFLVLNVDPVIGMVFVAGLLSLGNTMDIIPAVLLGYPSVATAVDFLEGHQLARRGLGARVLGASYAVSMFGGLIGALAMAFALPLMRPFITSFSYAEIAALALFGVAMVAVLARGAVFKALGAAMIGLLLATIGSTPTSAVDRFTLGQLYLVDGLPLIPTILGIFALPEIVDLAMSKSAVAQPGSVSNREVWIGFKEGLQRWRTIPRQSLFGVFMGAIPGIGGAAIEWLSYALGIAFSKDKSQFGKGSMDGILFTESAQSAKEAGQAIPTLAFGIPGGSGWALCLAAMIAYGIAPGLGMLGQNLDITMGIVLTIGLGNLLGTILALFITGQVARLTLIPYQFVAGMILPLMFLSAVQARSHWGDIVALLSMGALGMAMKWFGWPRPPLILAFVLGRALEQNLWTAISIGGPLIFVTRPYALTIIILAVLFAVYMIRMLRSTQQQVEQAVARIDLDAPIAPPISSGGMAAAMPPDEPERPRRFAVRPRWRWEHLLWLALAAWAGGIIFRESLRYTGPAQFFPLLASSGFLLILVGLVITDLLRPDQRANEIMDIGMRTGTGKEAFRAFLPIVGWIIGFIALMGILGLQLASIVFPAIYITASLRWRGKKALWVLAPVALSTFVSVIIMENVLNVYWPEPFITSWVQRRF